MSDEFRAGDTVALRKEFLKADEEDVSCTKVLKAGFPNEFVVSKAGTHGGVPTVSLWPCCGRLLGKDGTPLCDAHPSAIFEPVRRASPGGKGAEDAIEELWLKDPKRFVSIDVPILGPLVHFGHYEDGNKEGLVLRIAGMKPFVLAGKDLEPLAALFSKVLPGAGKKR